MKIRVDPDLCIGSGNCTHLAKGVFELDDSELAQVADPQRGVHRGRAAGGEVLPDRGDHGRDGRR